MSDRSPVQGNHELTTPVRPASPRAASDVSDWALEADVVVAGYGVAGASAAIDAARAGADVLVLERAGGWGGAAALSGGFIYLGGGTPLQKACGFEDSPSEMAKFLMAAMGPGADAAKVDLFSERSVEHYRWLEGCGVEFRPGFYDEPAHEPDYDACLMYSGGENAFPYNEIAVPAPRGHLPWRDPSHPGERSRGWVLMDALTATAASLGVRAEFDVRIERLVIDDVGAVVGLVATRFGNEIAVRARRGVVLGSGSFSYNDSMVARFAPRILGHPMAAIEEHDGQAIRMAQAIGADLANIDGCEVTIAGALDPQLGTRGMIVNAQGQRFVAEDTYPGRIGEKVLYEQGNEAFLVLDLEIFENAPMPPAALAALRGHSRQNPTWVAETVGELEAEMGLPSGSLEMSVQYYNRFAALGQDPMFHKDARWLKPLTPPFGAFDFRNRTGGFTLGGLFTDVDGRVIHVDGHAIGGLFAAGRASGGLPARGYASGASLADGSFFGRRAGAAAATSPES